MRLLNVAAVQTAGSADNNLDLVESEVRAIARRFPWVSLVTFGELAVNGASLTRAEPPGGATEQRLCALARETGVWLIPGSLYEQRGAHIFNTAPVINPSGRVVFRYDKMFPFLPYEKGVTPGSEFSVFEVPGVGTIGIVICYDIWFPEVVRTLCAMGAEAIIVPTMTNTIDRDVELAIARTNAAIGQCYVVDINCAGEQGNGRSVVYAPGGETIYQAGDTRDVIALQLDLDQVTRCRATGWNGLGQVMKSFRDSRVSFPLHADPERRRHAMGDWGPLALPSRPDAPTDEPAITTRLKPDHAK